MLFLKFQHNMTNNKYKDMNIKDLNYLMAYLLPLCAFVGLSELGIWSFLTPVVTFGLIPIIEVFTPEATKNLSEQENNQKKIHPFFDVLLYLNVFLIYGVLVVGLHQLTQQNLATWEVVGVLFSMGIILGSNGINVAHELGHRESKLATWAAKLLLIPSFYTHFTIEHNYGHHSKVATPEDPATARLNQNLYHFWFQSAVGQYINAWKLAQKIPFSKKHYLLKNEMYLNTFLQLIYIVLIFSVFGRTGLFMAIIAGIIGFLLLETINYIEHYGLQREQRKSGRYVPVKETHSWNSNHMLGRILLYELTRHSDHHFRAQKKYQILEYHEVSPQLPFGYPTSMLLAAFPPIWFNLMNKRIKELKK